MRRKSDDVICLVCRSLPITEPAKATPRIVSNALFNNVPNNDVQILIYSSFSNGFLPIYDKFSFKPETTSDLHSTDPPALQMPNRQGTTSCLQDQAPTGCLFSDFCHLFRFFRFRWMLEEGNETDKTRCIISLTSESFDSSTNERRALYCNEVLFLS